LPDHKVAITDNRTVIIKGADRVWKGIFGIRDLTKLRCGIRENAKCLDGKRDLNGTREAGFLKICTQDAGFFPSVSGIWEIMTTQIQVLAANPIHQGERSVVSPIN